MSNDEINKFTLDCKSNIQKQGKDDDLKKKTLSWILDTAAHKYTYNFSILGRPIIQYPQDIVAIQEIIWQVKPDLVIETGIAHGGSLILSASMLALLDYCDSINKGTVLDPKNSKRKVIGLDIDIRAHNRYEIERHPLSKLIHMIQGSSIAASVINEVKAIAANYKNILVILDSNHTHEHVLAELEAYAPLVSKGSYCCVFDTIIEDMPDGMFPNRPWGQGNNPKTAVNEFIKILETRGKKGIDGEPLHFKIKEEIDDKLLISVAPNGYLYRTNSIETK